MKEIERILRRGLTAEHVVQSGIFTIETRDIPEETLVALLIAVVTNCAWRLFDDPSTVSDEVRVEAFARILDILKEGLTVPPEKRTREVS